MVLTDAMAVYINPTSTLVAVLGLLMLMGLPQPIEGLHSTVCQLMYLSQFFALVDGGGLPFLIVILSSRTEALYWV